MALITGADAAMNADLNASVIGSFCNDKQYYGGALPRNHFKRLGSVWVAMFEDTPVC